MIRLAILFLLLCSSSFAQKVLHVSTIPNNADIYVQMVQPDLSNKPSYKSPAFVPISSEDSLEGQVLISLFKPEFADTTLKIKLSSKDTSYIIISQQPLLDEEALLEQQNILFKRARKELGQKLRFASIFPFAVGLVAGGIAAYEIKQANDCKESLENSAIADTPKFRKTERDFKDYRRKAKVAKYTALSGLVIGASLFAIGFAISF